MRIHRHIIPHPDNNHRPWALRHKALFVYAGILLILQAVLSYTPLTTPKAIASTITSGEIISLTNSARSSHGLPALKINGALNLAASNKAVHMLKHNYWSHTAPDGTTPWYFISRAGYNYLYAGENLAKDFIDANSVISAWMASSTHRNNVLNRHYQDMGTAVVEGTLVGKKTILVVQMFGKQVGAPPRPGPVAKSPSKPTSPSLDTTPPEPPEILEPENGTVTRNLRLKIEGLAEASSEVGVYDGDQRLGSIPTDSEGSFTYRTEKDLSEGLHNFSADATDAAGNTSSKSEKIEVIVDITPAKIIKKSLKMSSEATRQGERYKISINLEEEAEIVTLTVSDYSLILEPMKCDIETASLKALAKTDEDSKSCFIYAGSFIPPQASLRQSRGLALITSYDEAENADEYEFRLPTGVSLAASSFINNSFLKRFFQNPQSALVNMFLALTLATLFVVDSIVIFRKNVARKNSHSSTHFLLILTAILTMLFLQNGNII